LSQEAAVVPINRMPADTPPSEPHYQSQSHFYSHFLTRPLTSILLAVGAQVANLLTRVPVCLLVHCGLANANYMLTNGETLMRKVRGDFGLMENVP